MGDCTRTGQSEVQTYPHFWTHYFGSNKYLASFTTTASVNWCFQLAFLGQTTPTDDHIQMVDKIFSGTTTLIRTIISILNS